MATYRVVDADGATWNNVVTAENERPNDDRETRNAKRFREAQRKLDGWVNNYRPAGNLRVVMEKEEGES